MGNLENIQLTQTERDCKNHDSIEAPLVVHLAAVAFTAEKLLLPQLEYLRTAGFRVRVACAPDSDGYGSHLGSFEPIDIRYPRSIKPLAMAQATLSLVLALRRLRPAILHLHTPAAAIPVRMLPRWLLPRGMSICYTVHGYAHTWTRQPRDRLLQELERWLTPRADVTLYQSREDLDQARAHGFRGDLRYLGNGVGEEWFDVPLPRRSETLKLVYVGRLVREKGLQELLGAIAQCAGIHLDVVGGQLESDRDGIEQELRLAGSRPDLRSKVTFWGMLDRAGTLARVQAADVIVLPSHREGVPRSLIEGMAAGRPAIATRIRGCRELVQDGASGVLFGVGDQSALLAAIGRIRDLPLASFRAWSCSSRAAMDKDHRESRVFSRIGEAYGDLLGFRVSAASRH